MRIGVIGAGMMARAHAESFNGIDGVSIAAFAARTTARAEQLARQFNARATTDLDALLADNTIDAVSVCVPDGEQRKIVLAALAAKKHVYCEAGPGESTADVEAMLTAGEQSARILAVAYFWRTLHEGCTARKLVESGELGGLQSVVHYRRFDEDVDPLHIARTDGDMVAWLAGKPKTVTASRSRDGRDILVLTRHGEILGVTEVTSRLPRGYPHTAGYRLVFDRGVLEFDISFANERSPASRFVRYEAGAEERLPLPDEGPWYRNGCRYFVEAIRGDKDPDLLGFRHALTAARTIRAARRSIETGATVALD